MNIVSLQVQRNLERFLSMAGIKQPSVSNAMRFSFPDHDLYIELRERRLWMTLRVGAEVDDEQVSILCQRVIPGLTTGYLFRPFRLKGAMALNVSLSEESHSEQLIMIYRTMLRLLIPWKKRLINNAKVD
jgi:hypothetical protein